MDLVTNYKTDFIKFENTGRTKKILSDNHSLQISNNFRPHFNGLTQNDIDFKSYPHHRPPIPSGFNPFNSNLDKLLFPEKK